MSDTANRSGRPGPRSETPYPTLACRILGARTALEKVASYLQGSDAGEVAWAAAAVEIGHSAKSLRIGAERIRTESLRLGRALSPRREVFLNHLFVYARPGSNALEHGWIDMQSTWPDVAAIWREMVAVAARECHVVTGDDGLALARFEALVAEVKIVNAFVP